MNITFTINLIHHIDPESKSLLREVSRKLNHVIERQNTMATDAQIEELKTDVAALLKAIADNAAKPPAPPPAPVPDPALDALDAEVKAATARLTAPPETP